MHRVVVDPSSEIHDWRAFRWRFHSIAEMRTALEDYLTMADLQLTPGKPPADGGEADPEKMDTTYRIMAQNAELDRKMYRLCVWAPLYHRLLDTYYRHGLCSEARGWQVAAKRCGLPAIVKIQRGRDVSRPQFDLVLDMALSALFHMR